MRATLLAIAATMSFASAPRTATAARVITNPDWLRKPTAQEVVGFWPAGARGMSGRVVVSCIVTTRGLLDKCEVLSELPAGHGFGGAALLLAHLFQMRPKTVDGVPVSGGEARIPINFVNRGAASNGLPPVHVANNLPWRQAPTAAQMAAAFPAQAVGKSASGRVVLRCRVLSDGSIMDCDTTLEAPAGQGFARAARGLTRYFKVASNWSATKTTKDLYVSLPFDFRDPAQPSPAVEVVDPEWLQSADPRMAGKLFPDEAAKAGYKTGVAVVDCALTHEGRLTGCSVSSENPAGLGFGAAALAITAVMIINPWTKQGDPVDGARLRMPIRVNLGAEPAPPAPAR